MNRKLNILIAIALTVMTLSACSNPATLTTAPSGTTTAGTTTAGTGMTTTAGTTQPVTMPTTTSPSTTAVATLPPATTTAVQPGSHSSDVANIYIKSAEAMASLNSFKMTSETQFEVMGNKVDTQFILESFPKENKARMSFPKQGIEMYTMGDKTYTKGPDGTWMYTVDTEPNDPLLGVVEQAEKITDKEYMDMLVAEKTADGYKIKTKQPLSSADFEKLGSNPDPAGMNDPTDPAVEPDGTTYEMEMNFNKDYYTTETIITIKGFLDKNPVVNHITMTYSDFNSLPAITLPAEALNAKELTIPGMPSTKP